MTQVLLIGIAAGLAAALLFAAPLSGAGIAFPLFLLTGLPIAIAGLGWTLIGALAASVVGAVAIFLLFSWSAAAIFVLVFCLPLCWVVRLATLSRPVDDSDPSGAQEWYPLGQMLFNLAVATAVGIVLTGMIVGFDTEALAGQMVDSLAAIIGTSSGTPADRSQLEAFVSFNVTVMPLTVAILAVAVLVFDLWLGAWVARMSGRLVRPRDRAWTVMLPRVALIILAAGVVLSFFPGALGEAARVVAGALGCAVAMVGLAVMHALTIGNNARGLILFIAYALLFVFGFPIVLFALIGIADSFLNFRARRFGAAPPTI
jgi:hypothetical protein